jgi:hypothetical protein
MLLQILTYFKVKFGEKSFLFSFRENVSLYSFNPGCPQNLNPPVTAFQVQGLQACTILSLEMREILSEY